MKRFQNGFVRAFTLIELLIVMACLVLLVAMLLPALARPKRAAPGYRCRNNLKQIGIAFRVWALDNRDQYPMRVSVPKGGTMELAERGIVFPSFLVMSNELSTPKILVCPDDPASEKRMATTFSYSSPAQPNVLFASDKNVSYFVGVDAENTQPSMLLTGDSNLGLQGGRLMSGLQSFWTNSPICWLEPRHGKWGNIGMADGSVQQASTKELRKALSESGVTNRLAIPEFP
jgi:prepilin-type processing-associated H-X9-DG protein